MRSLFINNKKAILQTASLLMLFAAAGAALVGLTYTETADDIAYNEKLTLLKKLNTILPADRYDNDLLLDTIEIGPHFDIGTKQATTAYRARKQGQNVAVIFSSIAPSGYNGPINLLVGVYADGKIAGVRVVQHRETPGLGDAVDTDHSDWINGFKDRSLTDPDEKKWKVKRDGGVFDQFTGATITPRAVVKAVHNALIYYREHKTELFERQSPSSTDEAVMTGNGSKE